MWLSVQNYAKLVGKSRQQVYNDINKGKVKVKKETIEIYKVYIKDGKSD